MGVSFTGSALGQSAGSRDAYGTTTINSANTPVDEPSQSSAGAVGTTQTNKGPTRTPFQMKLDVGVPRGTSGATQFFPIPAGKRLVIENVSALGLCSQENRMEIHYSTAVDDGNGQGDSGDISTHWIVLTHQGTSTDGTATLTANHKVLVFADELIGETHFQIRVQVSLLGIPTQSARGVVTFSGYMEDLPVTQ